MIEQQVEKKITAQDILNAIAAEGIKHEAAVSAIPQQINELEKNDIIYLGLLTAQQAEIAALRTAVQQIAERGVNSNTESPYVY